MENKAIKEYDDFTGKDGYVIVDGLDGQTPGGKKLLSEVGGSGARYTQVTITNPTVSDGKITISPANNTIVTVTGLPDESFNFEIVAPQVAEGEYIDIVIQAKTASGDNAQHPIEATGFANVTMYEYGPKTMLVSDGSWTHIAILGKCMLVYWEVASDE
jgi:hypothetical protein